MVFTDLERGAVAVVKSMGRESSKTIGHKYGEDAGKVADDSMTAAAHGINLAYVRILLNVHNNYFHLLMDIFAGQKFHQAWLQVQYSKVCHIF